MTTETTTSNSLYDVIVVGAACAGLSAAIYATRRAMKTLILTKNLGGQTSTTDSVENYPGIDSITGPDLIQNMLSQALKWGSEILFEEVIKVEKNGDKDFTLTTHTGSYKAKSVILAYGKTPRNLGVEGEIEYTGKGVSYCVTCDAPLYKNKTTLVVGGGNSALQGALLLSKISKKVYLMHRRDEFRADEITVENVLKTENIEVLLSYIPTKISGGKYVEQIHVQNLKDQTEKTLDVDGIFIEVGFSVSGELVQNLVDTDKVNQILINNKQETSLEGVFAAGDVTETPYKQMVIASAEGAKAALSAYGYVFDGRIPKLDWNNH